MLAQNYDNELNACLVKWACFKSYRPAVNLCPENQTVLIVESWFTGKLHKITTAQILLNCEDMSEFSKDTI